MPHQPTNLQLDYAACGVSPEAFSMMLAEAEKLVGAIYANVGRSLQEELKRVDIYDMSKGRGKGRTIDNPPPCDFCDRRDECRAECPQFKEYVGK